MSHSKTAYSKVASPTKYTAIAEQSWNSFPYLTAVMILVTLVSIFHVWSRVKVIDLNLQLAESNRFYREQQQENKRLRVEIASLKTPSRIEALAKGELGMALPSEQQVVHVK